MFGPSQQGSNFCHENGAMALLPAGQPISLGMGRDWSESKPMTVWLLAGFRMFMFFFNPTNIYCVMFFQHHLVGGFTCRFNFFSAIQKGLVDMTSILLEWFAGIHLPMITRIAGFWSCRNTITFSSMIYQDLYTVWFYTGDVPVRRLRWFCCFFLDLDI
jgi:hypothetical protein